MAEPLFLVSLGIPGTIFHEDHLKRTEAEHIMLNPFDA
jgi:hypothetical protein